MAYNSYKYVTYWHNRCITLFFKPRKLSRSLEIHYFNMFLKSSCVNDVSECSCYSDVIQSSYSSDVIDAVPGRRCGRCSRRLGSPPPLTESTQQGVAVSTGADPLIHLRLHYYYYIRSVFPKVGNNETCRRCRPNVERLEKLKKMGALCIVIFNLILLE